MEARGGFRHNAQFQEKRQLPLDGSQWRPRTATLPSGECLFQRGGVQQAVRPAAPLHSQLQGSLQKRPLAPAGFARASFARRRATVLDVRSRSFPRDSARQARLASRSDARVAGCPAGVLGVGVRVRDLDHDRFVSEDTRSRRRVRHRPTLAAFHGRTLR